MANPDDQYGRVDANHNPSLTAVSGTAGTADQIGTAAIVRITADPATGAMYVNNLGAAGGGGTVVTVDHGTLGSILGIGGTVQVSGASAGTNVNIVTGTVTSVGTNVGVGTLSNLGSFTSGGTVKEISNLAGGTLGSILGIGGTVTVSGASAGTNVNIVTGTQQTLGTVGTVIGVGTISNIVTTSGTVTGVGTVSGVVTTSGTTTGVGTVSGVVTTSGTVTGVGTLPGVGSVTNLGSITNIGSIAAGVLTSLGTVPGVGVVSVLSKGTIAVGTTVGATASGGTPTTNPVLVAGTDATGTVYAPLVTSGGILKVVDTAGTVSSVGTVVGIGTISNIVTTSGTVTGVGTVSGVVTTLGTTTGVGTVPGVGSITNLGSVTNVGSIAAGVLTSVGTIPGVGIVTRIGNIGTIESGTVTTTLALNTGTITTIAAGTQNTLGTVGAVNSIVAGTQNTLGTVGVLNAGSVVVTVGTVGGKAASGAASVANPILIAGTDAGGTVYAPIVTSAGALSTTASLALNTGTLTTIAAGTQNTLGTVGVVNNLVKGTITALETGTITTGTVSVTTGTVTGKEVSGGAKVAAGILLSGTDSGGTIYHPLITSGGAVTVTGASAGTNVNIVTGTQQTLGTVGVVNNLVKGTITALETGTLTALAVGTVGGKAASGAAAVANPVLIAGTDAGGTVYAPIVTSAGALSTTASLALNTGTLTTIAAGTQNTLGTVGTVIGVGTISNVVTTSGTVTGVGTVPGVGSVTNLGSITNVGSIAAGNLTSSGTTTGVGVVSNLTNGSVNILTGTVSINPTPVTAPTSYGTVGTTGAAVWGTLVAAVGAGTKIYLAGASIVVQSGTVDVALTSNVAGSTGTGVFLRGQFPAGGGIDQDFMPTHVSGTNGTLAWWMGGAGTVAVTAQYWIGV